MTMAISMPDGCGAAGQPGEQQEVKWLHVGGSPPSNADAQQRWAQFVADDPTASIHSDPQLVLAAARRDGYRLLVYAHWDSSGGLRSLAVLPERDMAVRIFPGLRASITLRGRRLLDNRILGDNSPESLERFIHAMSQLLEQGQTECIVCRDLELGSPLRQALADRGRRQGPAVICPSQPTPHRWIRFPESPEQYWSQFSKKTRYNFRYRAKHLEHTIRCIRDPADVPLFAQKVRELLHRTWQSQRLGKDDEHLARQTEYWQRLAAIGAFRSYLLEQGDQVLAFSTGVQWKGCYAYEETGYDPTHAAKSPGQVLLYRMLEDLIANDTPSLFDFGFGDSDYKRIFSNHQTLTGPLVLVRRSLRPMLAMRMEQCRSALGRGARAALAKTGVLSRLRHIHRGHHAASRKGAGTASEAGD